jgi:hypothetical protein
MTLTLTESEAQSLICDLKGVDTVVITSTVPVNHHMNTFEAVIRVCYVEHPGTYFNGPNFGSRIPAIKRLRELTGFGLVEAKEAVEYPIEFLKKRSA